MTSIVLRTFRPGHYALALRQHDLSGVGYTNLTVLEAGQAAAVAGDHTGIHALFDSAELHKGVEKKPILIERVPDRLPGARAWQMRIGDELVTRVDQRDGIRKAIRLDDEAVHMLAEHTKAQFAAGEPDWVLREVEILEDQALELEMAAAEARAKSAVARAAWEVRMSAAPEPEAVFEVEP